MCLARRQSPYPGMVASKFPGDKRAISCFRHSSEDAHNLQPRRFVTMVASGCQHSYPGVNGGEFDNNMGSNNHQEVLNAHGVPYLQSVNVIPPTQDGTLHAALGQELRNGIEDRSWLLNHSDNNLRLPPRSPLDANVALAVKESCNIGYVHVVDCTQSHMVAAKQLGRKAIGIEIEEKYCRIAVERLSQSVMQFDEPLVRQPKHAEPALFPSSDAVAVGAKESEIA